MTKLILVRGLPGSGKSCFARALAYLSNSLHYETDMFFDTVVGRFDKYRLEEAHNWCKALVDHYLYVKHNCIVSNTFSQRWEIDQYVAIANKNGASIEVIKMNSHHKNTREVPFHVIRNMQIRWEDYPGEINFPEDFS